MICPACHFNNPADGVRCGKCGAPLLDVASATVLTKVDLIQLRPYLSQAQNDALLSPASWSAAGPAVAFRARSICSRALPGSPWVRANEARSGASPETVSYQTVARGVNTTSPKRAEAAAPRRRVPEPTNVVAPSQLLLVFVRINTVAELPRSRRRLLPAAPEIFAAMVTVWEPPAAMFPPPLPKVIKEELRASVPTEAGLILSNPIDLSGFAYGEHFYGLINRLMTYKDFADLSVIHIGFGQAAWFSTSAFESQIGLFRDAVIRLKSEANRPLALVMHVILRLAVRRSRPWGPGRRRPAHYTTAAVKRKGSQRNRHGLGTCFVSRVSALRGQYPRHSQVIGILLRS